MKPMLNTTVFVSILMMDNNEEGEIPHIPLPPVRGASIDHRRRAYSYPLNALESAADSTQNIHGLEDLIPLAASRKISLNLANMGWTEVPLALQHFSQVVELDLSGNKLTELPVFVENLSHLKKLNLANNQIVSLPEQIGRLNQLEELDLSDNLLSVLPNGMKDMSNLLKLNLKNNRFAAFPSVTKLLPRVQELALSQNGIEELNIDASIGSAVENGSRYAQFSSLKKLELDANKLATLPANFGDIFHGLSELFLQGNELRELPKSLSQLDRVERINLSKNQLRVLPEWICALTTLRFLDVSNNKISTLPNEINKLQALQGLIIAGNRLSNLPNQYKDLKQFENHSLFIVKYPPSRCFKFFRATPTSEFLKVQDDIYDD
jgi:leucine-rich repeat protein SHOC2